MQTWREMIADCCRRAAWMSWLCMPVHLSVYATCMCYELAYIYIYIYIYIIWLAAWLSSSLTRNKHKQALTKSILCAYVVSCAMNTHACLWAHKHVHPGTPANGLLRSILTRIHVLMERNNSLLWRKGSLVRERERDKERKRERERERESVRVMRCGPR